MARTTEAGDCWLHELCIPATGGGNNNGSGTPPSGGGGGTPTGGWTPATGSGTGNPPGGSGSGGNGTGNPPGGGGNNGGGWWSGVPCLPPASARTTSEPIAGCPPEWVPLPDRDANGFLISRVAELNNILSQNPYALLECDSLALMAMEHHGAMYQRTAQYTPPPYVMNRIDSIRNNAPNWVVDNFNLQNLQNAYGALVNCDFSPVRIKQLPPGMTTRSLLEYFRTHINSFIGPSAGGVSFAPYCDVPFCDTDKFNSPYESSLGALISINIPGLGPNFLGDDGSVILSEYYYNALNDYARFTFTTMETPLDEEHPVAGNREFGVYADPKRPGEYAFYTMGVDRVWDLGAAIKNRIGNGFEKGDNLWSSIQTNIAQYIINHGGQAEFYTPSRYTPRPIFDAVEDFLLGNGDINDLKRKLGC